VNHSSATNVRDMDTLLKVLPAGSDAYCVRDHKVTESAAAVCTPVPTVEALTRSHKVVIVVKILTTSAEVNDQFFKIPTTFTPEKILNLSITTTINKYIDRYHSQFFSFQMAATAQPP